MDADRPEQAIFTDQGIQNISAFAVTLKRIHSRLIFEGYSIKGGEITKPNGKVKKPTNNLSTCNVKHCKV